jgi:ribonuclease HI
MLVTIISDASFCPDTKVAGYAGWIASQRGKEMVSGPMQEACFDSMDAEMKGIINSIIAAGRKSLLQKGDKLIMQCDCIAAIERLNGYRAPKNDREAELFRVYEGAVLKLGIEVEFRHVKGHYASTDGRYAANRACDRKAKEHMRHARGRSKLNAIKEVVNAK